MSKPTLLLYTHTDFSDVWPIFFGQTSIYMKDYDKTILVNRYSDEVPKDYKQLVYDESLPYHIRVHSCLSEMEDKPLLFLHEDMILYQEPIHADLASFFGLVENNQADFIKLIKAGNPPFEKSGLHNNLTLCPKGLLFSIQPTITTVNKLKHIYLMTPGSNIWDFESRVSGVCEYLGYTNCYMTCYDSESKRGLAHWDSQCFPYIATAVTKGKWNYSEYPKELDSLFNQYAIDKTKRGTV